MSIDNAPGFQSLLNNSDNDLKNLDIVLIKTDELNKNSNAVIDKACIELEEELKRQEPEGTKISLCTLKRAIINLNSKLRRRGNISAYEIHNARDQNTGSNLNLNDVTIRNDQLAKRQDTRKIESSEVNIGDTVKVKNNNQKHKASDIYVVTRKEDQDVTVQRIIHPLKSVPTKLMSKPYKTKSKLLKTIHRAKQPRVSNQHSEDEVVKIKTTTKKLIEPWNPFNQEFYDNTDSECEENNIDTNTYQPPIKVENLTESDSTDQEIEWDNSPELVQLYQDIMTSPNGEDTYPRIEPRRLFVDQLSEDVNDNGNNAPKLQRRNAMRRKKNPMQITRSEEPKRTSKSRIPRKIRSNPTTPNEVVLNAVNNLNDVLRPHTPIVHEAVQLENVQRLETTLQQMEPRNRRRSARIQEALERQGAGGINYREMHKTGRR